MKNFPAKVSVGAVLGFVLLTGCVPDVCAQLPAPSKMEVAVASQPGTEVEREVTVGGTVYECDLVNGRWAPEPSK